MKKHISLIILFLCSYLLQAQEEIITIRKDKPIKELKKGAYYKNPEIEKLGKPFEGTWVYRNEKETLTIKIDMKKTFFPTMGVYIDKHQLEYSYDKGNGQVISNINTEDYSKIGSLTNETVASFLTTDMIKEKGIYMKVELLGNNQLKMILKNRPGDIWDSVNITGEPKQKKI